MNVTISKIQEDSRITTEEENRAKNEEVNRAVNQEEIQTANVSCFSRMKLKKSGIGVLFNLAASFLYAISYVLMKDIIDESNVLTITVTRMFIQSAILIPALVITRSSALGVPGERIYLMLNALADAGFLICVFYSFAFISATETSTIYMAYPVLITFISPCLLGEKFERVYVFTALLSVAGILLIYRPPFIFGYDGGENVLKHSIGTGLAVGAGLFCAAICILSRKLGETSSWTISATSSFASGVICLLPMVLTGRYNYVCGGVRTAESVLSAVIFAIGNVCFYRSYKLCEAGPLSIVGMMEISFILASEVIVLGYRPSMDSLFGLLLVLLGTTVTAIWKWKRANLWLSDRFSKISCLYKRNWNVKAVDDVHSGNVFVINGSFDVNKF